ncbi:hypothetical protein L218DRAFT_1008142 [Marasmius fiardii PR-910]|nr:hypothetical protein L218DRAFT_1008142 [Marasmius fiardii PR-910]
MTTIESLPPEITIQIIKTASQLEFQQDSSSLPSVILHCSKVSRQWRSIVLQNPVFFSKILIPFTALRDQHCSVREWIKFWLDRSATLPVTLLFRFHPPYFPEDFEVFRSLLTAYIIPNISRIEGFHFLCLERGLVYSISTLLSSLVDIDAPVLQELIIRSGTEGRMMFSSLPLLPIFGSTQSLRTLVIHGSDAAPHLQELRELDIHHVSISDASFRQLASNCPRLETLALRSIHISEPSLLDSKSPIPMVHLHSLVLEFVRGTSVLDTNPYNNVLACIVAPNLDYLEVSSPALQINLIDVLPDPTALRDLKKIKLVGISKTISRRSLIGGGDTVNDNSNWFKQLPESVPIEEIHLSHTSSEILGIQFPVPASSRNRLTGDDLDLRPPYACRGPEQGSRDIYLLRGINFNPVPLFGHHSHSFSPPLSITASGPFKHLKSITVESFVADDMVWLCRLVSSRPNVRSVYLSKSALSTLRASLVLFEDSKLGGWFVKIQKPGYMTYRLDHVEEKGVDAEKWVRERVKLKVLGT